VNKTIYSLPYKKKGVRESLNAYITRGTRISNFLTQEHIDSIKECYFAFQEMWIDAILHVFLY